MEINSVSRRSFLKASALAAGTAMVANSGVNKVLGAAAGSDKLRVGLLGCGKRGSGAINDCLSSSENLEVSALGDIFIDSAKNLLGGLKQKWGDKCKVTEEKCFGGFDAYKKVIEADVDVVLMCVPPGFRPLHLKAAIEAGKHVFVEKPVAVDPVGVRSVMASAKLAAEKKLGIVAGTQRRHQKRYVEAMKRINDGAIGDITAMQVYWIGDYNYYPAVIKKPEWSEMEWQIRNWNYFTWLSGDHIVEQHVHNLDIAHWAMKGPPIKAIALGGRQQRTGPEYGHIYDHFSVEFEYPHGVKVSSYCRQNAKTANRISESVIGTKGFSNCHGFITGENKWDFNGDDPNPYVQEHRDLIDSIRAGNPLNEGQRIAESTLMGILGRMSAYTGREISWDWVLKASKLDLTPGKYEFGPNPVDGVAIPGETPLI